MTRGDVGKGSVTVLYSKIYNFMPFFGLKNIYSPGVGVCFALKRSGGNFMSSVCEIGPCHSFSERGKLAPHKKEVLCGITKRTFTLVKILPINK